MCALHPLFVETPTSNTYREHMCAMRCWEQEAIGKQLIGLSVDWTTLVQKNMDISLECSTLEAEIAELQDEEDAALKADASSDAPMET